MRVALALAALMPMLLPATAAADYPHVVQRGETLTSVAATDGLSLSALAAANHLSTTAELIAGQILEIPPRTRATSTSATIRATVVTSTSGSSATPATASTPVTSTTTGGSAVRQSALTSVTTLASAATSAPQPTAERVSGAEIAEIAQSNGVPAALAEAVAWEESGWNNSEVSPIGAVGVMQIVPSTWSWINSYLTPGDPLGSDSASENVRAGVLLLRQLLLTANSQALAVAGYYQGLSSVETHGMYASTRRYVANVLALEHRLTV